MTIASNSSLYLLHASKRKQFNLLTLPKSILIALLIAVLVSPCILQALGEPTWNTQLVDPSGAGGSIVFDSNGNPHIAYTTETIVSDSASVGLNYAVWTGTNWNIQTVDPSGSGGFLALDSMNNPHILYTDGYSLKYAVLNGKNWNIQTIYSSASSEVESYSMALDSNGNPHVVYAVPTYSDNNYGYDIKYAVLVGSNWVTQTIDSFNSTWSGESLSIALDSNNNPHIIYLEPVQYQYPNPNSGNNPSFWATYTVKYASLTGSNWLIQTLFANSSGIGNLVLNFKGQPCFCYGHENWTYIPPPLPESEGGSFLTNGTANYAYWNGYTWLSQPIDSKPAPSGQTYLKLDSNGNPQVYFWGLINYGASIAVMCASWTGSGWNVENLGSFPLNTAYYSDTGNIDDIAFGADGKLGLTIDGEVDTIQGAPIYGGLTYASLKTTGVNSTPSTSITLPIIATAVVLAVVVVVVVSLLLYMKKRKTINSSQQTVSSGGT